MAASQSEQNRLVRSLVLVSTISAAADVASGMVRRRRGVDPSEQENAGEAVVHLAVTVDELEDLLLALRATRALYHRDPRETHEMFARGINEILLLNRLVGLLRTIHQRLLSVYPLVSEELIEEARVLELTAANERDEVGTNPALDVIERTNTLIGELRTTLSLR